MGGLGRRMKRIVNKAGFTIVELLIVIVVIGILAAITIVAFNGIQERGRDATRGSDIRALKTALSMYKVDNDHYPTVCATMYYNCNASNLASVLIPKYIDKIPSDPKTGTSGYFYEYVSDAAPSNRYGIRVRYESKPECKTGDNINPGWFNSAMPRC